MRFEMDAAKPVEGSTAPKSAHMRQVEKTLKRKIIQRPECPTELQYLWCWFCEIYNGAALTFTEIKHWSELTHTHIQAWEASLLSELSRITV